jgi:hypothetical protein
MIARIWRGAVAQVRFGRGWAACAPSVRWGFLRAPATKGASDETLKIIRRWFRVWVPAEARGTFARVRQVSPTCPLVYRCSTSRPR